MLINLTPQELDSIVRLDADGAVSVDRHALLTLLDGVFETALTNVAINSIDYSQHADGTPEPDTRTVKGVAWASLSDNRCHKWSFRTDGRALSTTDEGEQRCPISEDVDLIARATVAIADQYSESEIDDRNARLTVTLPDGTIKKVRVVTIHDPRVIRPEDVLDNDMELIAFNAGTLGVVLVQPRDDGQAVVRKIGC
jgi:hypothetical protein